MKKLLSLFILFPALLYAQDNYRLFINNLNFPFDNKGVLADVDINDPDPFISGPGAKYDSIVFLFSGGFYLSGYSNDILWANGVLTASLLEDYQPGIVGSDPNSPENIIYVVSSDDSPFGQSWQNWIDAVDLGADYYDGNNDGIYNPVDLNSNGQWDENEDKPDLIGDLTAWCVFNDGVPASERRWGCDPLGIEIQQTVFAYKNSHPIFGNTANTIFIRYRIKNTGTEAASLDSVYFSLFSDFDIGFANDDLGACDTLLFGSFGYNDSADAQYGNDVPAFFHHFLQFPHVFIEGETFIDNNGNGIYDPGIDTALDTAFYNLGSDIGIFQVEGAKNQVYSSSVYSLKSISPGFNDPNTKYAARNYSLGKTTLGNIFDPCNTQLAGVFGGVNCSEVNPIFWGSGDPVTNTGWISIQPWDMRTISTTGPFNLSENESYDIITAYTAGRGSNHHNSITIARQNVIYTRRAYNSNFGQFAVNVPYEKNSAKDFELYQNYPNPFNPVTVIKYQISNFTLSGVEGSLVTLKVYDILGREVATLVNEAKPAGNYEVEFNASSLSSGIYFYELRASSYVIIRKMILLK